MRDALARFRFSGTSVKDWVPVFFLRGFKAHPDPFPVAFPFSQMIGQLIRAKESAGNGFRVCLEIPGDIPAQYEDLTGVTGKEGSVSPVAVK